MTQTMIDVTGADLPALLHALQGRYPAVLAGYVTGSHGVDWPAGFWTELAGHTGLFRYDQSPGLALFASGAADAADVEAGAADLAMAVTVAQAREHKHGWWSWLYFSAGQLEEARRQVAAAGLRKVRYIVADWDLDHAEAEAFLKAHADVNGVQWASPTSNPHTNVPGTTSTLAELNCDLNVVHDAWFSPPAPARASRRLSGLSVTFADGTSEHYGT
jgi:hypothetical protein